MEKRVTISRRKRLVLSLRVGLLTAVLLLLFWLGDFFPFMRLTLSDFFYVPRPTSSKVVIVAVDNTSLATYGRSLVEWPRSIHADLVNLLSNANARVIAFDVLFSESTTDDAVFAEAIMHARESGARTRTVMPVVGAHQVASQTRGAVNYTYMLAPVEPLRSAVDMLGSAAVSPDIDGTVRWQPMRASDAQQTWLGFSAAVYLSYLRIPAAAISQVVRYEDGILSLTSERRIPVDDFARMRMNYFGAPASGAFPIYSYQAVLKGEVDPAVFDDRIVLVGLMDATGATDNFPVPVGSGALMAGVEIQANVIETLIQNLPVYEQNRLSQAIMIAGLTLLASVIYGQVSWRWLLAALISGVLSWLVFAFVYFNLRHAMLNLFDSILALAIPALVILMLDIVLENRRRRWTEMLLLSAIAASSQGLRLKQMLPGIANDLCKILNGTDVEVWLWNADGQDLDLAYTLSQGNAETASQEPAENHKRLALRALDTGGMAQEMGYLALPLTWQGMPVGVMLTARDRAIDQPTRSVLDLFTWQTALVIANANLYAEAQRLNQLKTRMVRMASHDLKNPLASVLGFSDFLRADHEQQPFLNETHLEFLTEIQQAALVMNNIVDDILNLERARAGPQIADTYDLLELLRRAVARQAFDLQVKRQTLTVEMPDAVPPLVGDYQQLMEVFSNLLENAVKYTPEDGRITLRVMARESSIRVEVEDSGYGIPKEAQAHLFQDFYRVNRPETAHIRGTGLGLSLAKTVVESHGGKIGVKSEENTGSLFYVEFPLRKE